ncbi:MAG: MCE family protein [Candidatus Kuenenia sp.]|nr:MCE family protein [Candidatus Kuenenia hertensis]
MRKEHIAELRAGIFTLITLVCLSAALFILGSQKGYFKPHITLKAQFLHVYGLQKGVPVRFMGVTVGQVKDIVLPDELPCTGIEVLLQIDKNVQKNIQTDSVATIKWLSYVTGDSYVEISSKDCRGGVVKDGDTIKSAEPMDYTTAIENGSNAIKSISGFFKKLEEGNLAETLNSVSTSLEESITQFQESTGLLHSLVYDTRGKLLLDNLITTSDSLNEIIEKIADGEGTLGALIADPELYDNLKRLLGGAERSRILRNVIRKSIEKGKTNTSH